MNTSEEVLLRITSHYFCAGLVVQRGRVMEAAPILARRFRGRDLPYVLAVCKAKCWTWERVRIH